MTTYDDGAGQLKDGNVVVADLGLWSMDMRLQFGSVVDINGMTVVTRAEWRTDPSRRRLWYNTCEWTKEG
jgi:hypothetical protein